MKRSILSLLLLSAVALAADFSRDGTKNVVIDHATNLMWQDDANVSNAGYQKSWTDAITYCENSTAGDFSDWRLPNINELKSIVDDTTNNPAMSSVFENSASSSYRSSTTFAGDSSYAWYVYFGSGSAYADGKTITYYVRCVRDN